MKFSLETFFKDKNAPLYQAGALMIAIIIGNLLGYLVEAIGITEWGPLFAWVISGSILLAYATLNTLIGLMSKQSMGIYYSRSIVGFLSLAMGAAVLAKAFSSISMGDAGSMRWIYIVISIGYLIFMGIMMLMRRIVEFAQKEDENLRHNK